MGKKKYFLIIDTETTQTDKVVDFGAVVCDKQGNVVNECGVLVKEYFLDREGHPLFHYVPNGEFLGGKKNLPRRYADYTAMLENGQRVLASVPAVNRWLAQALAAYDPIVTAYNWAFDKSKMTNTGIQHEIFRDSFCLWHASAEKWGQTKAYRQMVMDLHAFNKPTAHRNMTYVTNAEMMARFVLDQPEMPDEPHTALEDAKLYELPILAQLVKTTKPSQYMNPKGYNWKDYQVKMHFSPK